VTNLEQEKVTQGKSEIVCSHQAPIRGRKREKYKCQIPSPHGGKMKNRVQSSRGAGEDDIKGSSALKKEK